MSQGAPLINRDCKLLIRLVVLVFSDRHIDHYDSLDSFPTSSRTKFIEEQLVGFDLDPNALAITRLRPSLQDWLNEIFVKTQLNQQDTLLTESTSDQRFDWVVGNSGTSYSLRTRLSDFDSEIPL